MQLNFFRGVHSEFIPIFYPSLHREIFHFLWKVEIKVCTKKSCFQTNSLAQRSAKVNIRQNNFVNPIGF